MEAHRKIPDCPVEMTLQLIGDKWKVLTRKVYPEVPPRVEYTLTETGRSLKPILDSMVAWGTDYKNTTAGKLS